MIDLKKNLPEIFEEFSEKRRAAFLEVKKIKDENIPVVGVFCTFFSARTRACCRWNMRFALLDK